MYMRLAARTDLRLNQLTDPLAFRIRVSSCAIFLSPQILHGSLLSLRRIVIGHPGLS